MAALANNEQFRPLLRRPIETYPNPDEKFTILQHLAFHLTSLLNICFTLGLLVTVPLYNDFYVITKSDSYNSLYFVVTISTLLLVLLTSAPAIVCFRNLCTTSYTISKMKRSTTMKTFLNILVDSFIFTVSLLCLSYCRDKNRVPCHLQDGLLFLAVPVAIAYMALIKRQKNVSSDAVRLIVYLTICMGLVFASTVFQLSFRFTCRNAEIPRDPESHSLIKQLWIGTYLIGIALFSISLSNLLSNLQDDSASYSRYLQRITWTHMSVLLMLSALFWTDLFPAIGGLETSLNLDEFWMRFKSTWCCHFTDSCTSTAKLGYVVIGFWFLLMITSCLLMLKFQSNPVVVISNASLALPLLPMFYELFQPDLLGIILPLDVSPNGIFGIVAFVCGYICLSLYHKEQRILTLNDYFSIF